MRSSLHSFFAFLRSSKKILLLILIVTIATIASTTTISLLLSRFHNFTIPSFGTIKTIGVEAYYDPNRENKAETLDWGTIWIGASNNMTLYIRSASNSEVTLNLNATNWIPANLSDYLTLTWDYNGTQLNPNEIIQVTLTLSSSYSYSFVNYLITSDVKNFNFDIHIVAHE